MTSAPAAQMAPQRRIQLLETAVREFAAYGYEGASLNRIIRACGMSKSSFYHFVGSKDALFDAVVDEIGRRLGARLRIPRPADLEGPHFWTTITELLVRLRAVSTAEQWTVDLGKLFHLNDIPSTRARSLQRVNKAMNTWLTNVIKAGRRCGAVGDDLPLPLQVDLTWSALWVMDRWSLQHIADRDQEQTLRIFAAQLATLRRMLEPSAVPATPPEEAAGRL